jgi:acetylglutamate kinase
MENEPILVVKIGGNVLDHRPDTIQFLKKFTALPGKKILIHGGGKLATDLSTRLGIETKMVDGRRITDFETLKVAAMVYAGWTNKSLVADLYSLGVTALGLSGADLNLVQANKRQHAEIDYGWVGDVSKVYIKRWAFLLENGIVPVLCAITHDGKGHLLNTNADTMATEVATAMSGKYYVKLLYCFEKRGVLLDQNDEKSNLASLDKTGFSQMKESGAISKGMIPKLENAFRAVAGGIPEVYICSAQHIDDYATGTKIV